MNWDNIKLFLALHREGSARSVANQYHLSPSTVTRRVSELENELDTKLFNRLPSGFQLTESGQNLLHVATRMEADAYEIERKTLADSGMMQGQIRLTIPSHFVAKPMMPWFAEFSNRHSMIELEVIPSYAALDLRRGEADIALRVMAKDSVPPEDLIGTRLVDIYCAVYAAADYVSTRDLADAKAANWLGWEDESRFPDWVLSSAFPHLPVKHHFNDPYMQLYGAKAGMGLVMMPCFMCDLETDLRRIQPDNKWHRFDLWMLSHPDLRDTLRFKEFRRFMREKFEVSRDLWMGETYQH